MVATAESALPVTNISVPIPSIVWWPLRPPPSAQHGILPVRADEARQWSCLRGTPLDLSIERGVPLIPALSEPLRAPSGRQEGQRSAVANPSSPPIRQRFNSLKYIGRTTAAQSGHRIHQSFFNQHNQADSFEHCSNQTNVIVGDSGTHRERGHTFPDQCRNIRHRTNDPRSPRQSVPRLSESSPRPQLKSQGHGPESGQAH